MKENLLNTIILTCENIHHSVEKIQPERKQVSYENVLSEITELRKKSFINFFSDLKLSTNCKVLNKQ